MPLITYTLPLDLESEAVNSPQAVIEVSKGDSNRQIVAVLFDEGQPYYPGDNAYALFSCPRRPGYDIIGPCTIIGNTVYYTFNDQTSALVGTWPCQILIYDSDGTELHTRSFTLKVSPAAYRRDVVQASSEFGGLASIVADFLQRSIGLETAINAKLGIPELYEAITGEEANAGVTIQDALAPLVTEDELTEAVRGLENNLAVDGAVYNALRAFVLQKTMEEMMARYQELLTPELFGALLERGGYFMSYDAVNRRLRATVGGVSMAALMLSGCLTTGGKTRLANYLDHGVFVATDAEAAQIETDVNHLVAELTEAVEHTVNISLPSLTSYVVSTVSGVSGAAANIAVVVPPAGTTRTVTITPVNGREITGVNVVGCDYTVTSNEDGSRTVVLQLTANTESVTVSAQTQLLVHDTNTVSVNGSTVVFTGGEYVGTGYKITRTYNTTTEKVTYYIDALSGYRVTASATVNGQRLGSVTEITVGMASSSSVNITVTAVYMAAITVDVDQYTTCVIRTGANLPYTDSKIAVGTTIIIELGASADATHVMDAYCDVSISGVNVGEPTEQAGKLIYMGSVSGDVNIRARADSKVATVTFVSDNTADFGELGSLGFSSFAEKSKTVEYVRGNSVSVYAKPRIAADYLRTSVEIPNITPAWLVSPRSSTEGGDDDCYIVATTFVRGNVTITVSAAGNTVTSEDGILTIGGLYAEVSQDGILDIEIE